MPLLLAEVGSENVIRKIGGNPEVRTHLENLGFVVGGKVTIISTIGGNLIVNVKGVQQSRSAARWPVKSWCRSMFYIDKVRRQCYENIESRHSIGETVNGC